MMKIFNTNRLILLFLLSAFLAFGLTNEVWAHGKGTKIVPATLNVKAGADLEVTVNGLVGTKTATFRLTGMFGKFELGEYEQADEYLNVAEVTGANETDVDAIRLRDGLQVAGVCLPDEALCRGKIVVHAFRSGQGFNRFGQSADFTQQALQNRICHSVSFGFVHFAVR